MHHHVPGCALGEVLITDQLATRPEPPRDFAAENAAFVELARQMASDPSRLLKCLAELATTLCHAGSAGVSLLEPGTPGHRLFRWVALSGEYAGYVGGTTPEAFSPCGETLTRKAAQLYAAPARHFTYLGSATPPIVEGLVIPLRGDAGKLGTIWIVSHDETQFTNRDVVVMTALADFTTAALALLEARTRAEELSRMKSEFLATVSHELRAPLNSILGWADVLLDGVVTPDRAVRALEAIHANARRQSVLIDDLIDTSRIAAGSMRLAQEVVNLGAIARRAIAAIESVAEKKGVAIMADIVEARLSCDGDAERLEQVVTNLLSNAVKFTPAGGSVVVSLRGEPQGVTMTVADTGIGMSEDQRLSMFEPFRQLDPSATRRQGGLGLGLSIARRLVELHGGTLEARSAGPDKGSTFVMWLPAARLETPAAPVAPLRPTALRPGSLAGFRILVVDDDFDHRELVEYALTHAGASVILAGSADEAMARLARAPVDILISDLTMPDEDGWSLIARVRAGTLSPDVIAIALSSHAGEAERQRSEEAGFDRHVAKPIDLAAFTRLILDTLERSPA